MKQIPDEQFGARIDEHTRDILRYQTIGPNRGIYHKIDIRFRRGERLTQGIYKNLLDGICNTI